MPSILGCDPEYWSSKCWPKTCIKESILINPITCASSILEMVLDLIYLDLLIRLEVHWSTHFYYKM